MPVAEELIPVPNVMAPRATGANNRAAAALRRAQ